MYEIIPPIDHTTAGFLQREPGNSLYALNFCSKHLSRTQFDNRHAINYSQNDNTGIRSSLSEAWRFPIVDKFRDKLKSHEDNAQFNQVTLVYFNGIEALANQVSVIGSFGNFFEPIPLVRIANTPYFYCTLKLPKRQVFTYKFLVDNVLENDPVNPQKHQFLNGEIWSSFFTDECTKRLFFSKWEFRLLSKLILQLLPFRSKDSENFFDRQVASMDRLSRNSEYPHLYRINQSVGVVNYIDKVLSKQERHHSQNYRICLDIINQVLRQRDPINEIEAMNSELFETIYEEIAQDSVVGWDYNRYNTPSYFLKLLRRHAYTGAFSHPQYGGNSGGSGWAYIEERIIDEKGKTLFDWQKNFEKPLGKSVDYNG